MRQSGQSVSGRVVFTSIAIVCVLLSGRQVKAQTATGPAQPGVLADGKAVSPNADDSARSHRIFGIVPNYRTATLPNPYTPLSAKDKLKIATQDSFDRGTFILAAAFAGESQLSNSNSAFGQGAAGYGRYLGTAYADFVIGDYMTEGLFPIMLHQDPRYFNKGTGSKMSRFGYAVGQIALTHNDSGHTAFNFSEILGNSTAVAISNAYYVDNRDVKDALVKLVSQLGVDAASNVLKEFWPDVKHKFSHNSPKD